MRRWLRFSGALLCGLLFQHCGEAAAPAADLGIEISPVSGLGAKKNMQADLIRPAGSGSFPAVLVLHTSGNVQSEDVEYAKQLAAKGYITLVPYYFDAYGLNSERRSEATTVYAEQLYADFVELRKYLRDTLLAPKVAAVGFSMGGYWALVLAATREVSVGVSYYGALSGGGPNLNLRYPLSATFTASSSPVLILHGTNDSTVSVSLATNLAAALSSKGSPHELVTYPGVEHTFDRGATLNAAARANAWTRTEAFLKR